MILQINCDIFYKSNFFQIRRTPPDEKRQRKQEKEDEAKKEAETEYPLDLVPFGKICHVPFDNIKYGDSAVRTVNIIANFRYIMYYFLYMY